MVVVGFLIGYLRCGKATKNTPPPMPENYNYPVGYVMPWMEWVNIPSGYLVCNGDRYSQAEYPELFANCNYMFGPTQPSGTFAIPDMRGRFLRGVPVDGEEHVGRTGGREELVIQPEMLPPHTHAIVVPQHVHRVGNVFLPGNENVKLVWPPRSGTSTNNGPTVAVMTRDYFPEDIELVPVGGNEVQPEPINVMNPYTITNWIIKATSGLNSSVGAPPPQAVAIWAGAIGAATTLPPSLYTEFTQDRALLGIANGQSPGAIGLQGGIVDFMLEAKHIVHGHAVTDQGHEHKVENVPQREHARMNGEDATVPGDEVTQNGGNIIDPLPMSSWQVKATGVNERVPLKVLNEAVAMQILKGPPRDAPEIGEVLAWVGGDDWTVPVPPGFLLCDGRDVSRSEYPLLFAAIGTLYTTSSSRGSGVFSLPDCRGRLIRAASQDLKVGDYGGYRGNKLNLIHPDTLPEHTHEIHVVGGGGDVEDDHKHNLKLPLDTQQEGLKFTNNHKGAFTNWKRGDGVSTPSAHNFEVETVGQSADIDISNPYMVTRFIIRCDDAPAARRRGLIMHERMTGATASPYLKQKASPCCSSSCRSY